MVISVIEDGNVAVGRARCVPGADGVGDGADFFAPVGGLPVFGGDTAVATAAFCGKDGDGLCFVSCGIFVFFVCFVRHFAIERGVGHEAVFEVFGVLADFFAVAVVHAQDAGASLRLNADGGE